MTNLPDVKLACITILNASADLDASVTIAGATQDNTPALLPFVVIYETPGPGAVFPQRLARSAINVQVWGSTAKEARDTAHTVYDILHASNGTTAAGAYIYSVADIAGPGENFEDEYPDLYRWVFTLEIRARNI